MNNNSTLFKGQVDNPAKSCQSPPVEGTHQDLYYQKLFLL